MKCFLAPVPARLAPSVAIWPAISIILFHQNIKITCSYTIFSCTQVFVTLVTTWLCPCVLAHWTLEAIWVLGLWVQIPVMTFVSLNKTFWGFGFLGFAASFDVQMYTYKPIGGQSVYNTGDCLVCRLDWFNLSWTREWAWVALVLLLDLIQPDIPYHTIPYQVVSGWMWRAMRKDLFAYRWLGHSVSLIT